MTGLLLDENLPAIPGLPTAQPVFHACDLGVRLSDSALWEYARQHDLLIVTKDADFSQRIILSSPPPRVVHLRTGNMRRRDFVVWIASHWPRIEALAKANKLVTVTLHSIQCAR